MWFVASARLLWVKKMKYDTEKSIYCELYKYVLTFAMAYPANDWKHIVQWIYQLFFCNLKPWMTIYCSWMTSLTLMYVVKKEYFITLRIVLIKSITNIKLFRLEVRNDLYTVVNVLDCHTAHDLVWFPSCEKVYSLLLDSHSPLKNQRKN